MEGCDSSMCRLVQLNFIGSFLSSMCRRNPVEFHRISSLLFTSFNGMRTNLWKKYDLLPQVATGLFRSTYVGFLISAPISSMEPSSITLLCFFSERWSRLLMSWKQTILHQTYRTFISLMKYINFIITRACFRCVSPWQLFVYLCGRTYFHPLGWPKFGSLVLANPHVSALHAGWVQNRPTALLNKELSAANSSETTFNTSCYWWIAFVYYAGEF